MATLVVVYGKGGHAILNGAPNRLSARPLVWCKAGARAVATVERFIVPCWRWFLRWRERGGATRRKHLAGDLKLLAHQLHNSSPGYGRASHRRCSQDLDLPYEKEERIVVQEWMLRVGGVFHLLCGLLHVVSAKALRWNGILARLPGDERPLVEAPLKIMNWCLGLFWLALAYIPIFHSRDLLVPGLGRTVLASIVIFWCIRIFVLQPVYMGIKAPVSRRMIGFFLIGLLLFGIPLGFAA